MDRSNLIYVILAGLAAGLLLNSCNDDKGRDTAGTTPGAAAPGLSSSEETEAASAASESTDSPTEAQASEDAPAMQTEDADKVKGDDILDRHWQETAIRFEKPMSMSMELRSAVFNPAEKATMSTLTFEANCRIGRKDWLYKELVMDSLKSTASAQLDLDICSVEMMPLLRNPVVSDRTSTGGTVLTMEGGLKFIVRDPEGAVMGTFLVNNDGELYEAESGELYSWRISETDDAMLPSQYLIYRTPGVGESIHYIIAISYAHGSKASEIVNDPLGNVIRYNFPNGSVELGPPAAPKRERRDPDKEYPR